MIKRKSWIYLTGLFISSLGSMTYAATLPILLFQAGADTAYIGFLIGSIRLNGFLVNSFLGHIGDRFQPRQILLFCEFGAALGSALILVSWSNSGNSGLLYFALANHVRIFFTALQGGSVQKIGKHYDTELGMAGNFAMRINGATNGALFFGGLFSLIFFEYITIQNIVLFDTLTFFVNGLLVFFFQSPEKAYVKSKSKAVSLNIPQYCKALPQLATLDVILSLVMCGSNTLNVRLLESRPDLVPMMPALFGAAAFFSSFFTSHKFHSASKGVWLLLAATLLIQGSMTEFPMVVLGISVIRNFCYWIIYQSISREVMNAAPSENFASIAAGRGAVSVLVLALGEFWVGLAKTIGIFYEMAWRALVAVFPVLFKLREYGKKDT